MVESEEMEWKHVALQLALAYGKKKVTPEKTLADAKKFYDFIVSTEGEI